MILINEKGCGVSIPRELQGVNKTYVLYDALFP